MHCQGPIPPGRGPQETSEPSVCLCIIRACEPGVLESQYLPAKTLGVTRAQRSSDGDVESRIKHQRDCKELLLLGSEKRPISHLALVP